MVHWSLIDQMRVAEEMYIISGGLALDDFK